MSQKKKRKFADILIVLCLLVCATITATVLYEYHRLCTPIPAEVLKALLRLWGGELLIIALRQVLGSDIVGKACRLKNSSTDVEENV